MRKPRCDGQETRKRLLDVACRLFAEKGFHKTTTQEICKKACTNPAAVNYYFKSKKNLYIESWQHAFDYSLECNPADGNVPPEASPEERLFGRISSTIRRIVDQNNFSFDIVHKEMANSTGYLHEVMQKSIKPIRDGLDSVILELLGEGATGEDVEMCHHSIMSQCFSPMLDFRKRKKKHAPKHRTVENIGIDKLERHIYEFCLAGISATRDNILRRNK